MLNIQRAKLSGMYMYLVLFSCNVVITHDITQTSLAMFSLFTLYNYEHYHCDYLQGFFKLIILYTYLSNIIMINKLSQF